MLYGVARLDDTQGCSKEARRSPIHSTPFDLAYQSCARQLVHDDGVAADQSASFKGDKKEACDVDPRDDATESQTNARETLVRERLPSDHPAQQDN